MRSHYRPDRSGPHSIHDARQHAFALLLFGPGAPAPRQRPHRGQLPDFPEAIPGKPPSAFIRFIRRAVFGRLADPAPEKGEPDGWHTETRDRLAA